MQVGADAVPAAIAYEAAPPIVPGDVGVSIWAPVLILQRSVYQPRENPVVPASAIVGVCADELLKFSKPPQYPVVIDGLLPESVTGVSMVEIVPDDVNVPPVAEQPVATEVTVPGIKTFSCPALILTPPLPGVCTSY